MKTLSILTLISCLLVACDVKLEKPFTIIDKYKDTRDYMYEYEDKNGERIIFHDTIKYNIGDTIK